MKKRVFYVINLDKSRILVLGVLLEQFLFELLDAALRLRRL